MNELEAEVAVTEEHDWISRSGAVWVFVVMTVSMPGVRRERFAVLIREGDDD